MIQLSIELLRHHPLIQNVSMTYVASSFQSAQSSRNRFSSYDPLSSKWNFNYQLKKSSPQAEFEPGSAAWKARALTIRLLRSDFISICKTWIQDEIFRRDEFDQELLFAFDWEGTSGAKSCPLRKSEKKVLKRSFIQDSSKIYIWTELG